MAATSSRSCWSRSALASGSWCSGFASTSSRKSGGCCGVGCGTARDRARGSRPRGERAIGALDDLTAVFVALGETLAEDGYPRQNEAARGISGWAPGSSRRARPHGRMRRRKKLSRSGRGTRLTRRISKRRGGTSPAVPGPQWTAFRLHGPVGGRRGRRFAVPSFPRDRR